MSKETCFPMSDDDTEPLANDEDGEVRARFFESGNVGIIEYEDGYACRVVTLPPAGVEALRVLLNARAAPFSEAPVARCKVTGHPCGTDTWTVGLPCRCEACQEWLKTAPADAVAATLVDEHGRPSEAPVGAEISGYEHAPPSAAPCNLNHAAACGPLFHAATLHPGMCPTCFARHAAAAPPVSPQGDGPRVPPLDRIPHMAMCAGCLAYKSITVPRGMATPLCMECEAVRRGDEKPQGKT